MIASRDPYKQEVARDTERFQPKAAQQTQQIEALQPVAGYDGEAPSSSIAP